MTMFPQTFLNIDRQNFCLPIFYMYTSLVFNSLGLVWLVEYTGIFCVGDEWGTNVFLEI